MAAVVVLFVSIAPALHDPLCLVLSLISGKLHRFLFSDAPRQTNAQVALYLFSRY